MRATSGHGIAQPAFAALAAQAARPYTSTFVLAETANAAARTPLRAEVCRLRDEMEARGRLVVPTADDWRLAWEGYRRGAAGEAGLVDHLSFALMRRLGILRAFTNDRHFRAAGFDILF